MLRSVGQWHVDAQDLLFDVSILHPKHNLIQACPFEHTCQQILYHNTCLVFLMCSCVFEALEFSTWSTCALVVSE